MEEMKLADADMAALGFLARHPDAGLNDLHHDLALPRSTITHVADRLERVGLVTRRPHPTSRRSTVLELTEVGAQVGEDVWELIAWIDESVVRTVSPEQVAGFHAVLDAIEEATSGR